MACNAHNHSWDCDCGWGGVSYVLPTPIKAAVEQRVSFTNPNARCPVCGQNVFFYRSESGGAVYFDSLGWPWPKHPCMDVTDPPSTRAKGGVQPNVNIPTRAAATVEHPHEWIPLEILRVAHRDGRSLIVGRLDQQVGSIKLGVTGLVETAPGIPAYIRAKPERRGIVDFSTLSNLEPMEIEAFLDCEEFEEVEAWERAIQRSHPDQNAVGWRLCFGRERKHSGTPSEFKNPNWHGGMHWICLAAAGGYVSALNNLGSKWLMRKCGIDAVHHDDFQRQLYACGKLLERSPMPGSEEREAAISEAKKLAERYLSLASDQPQSR